MAMERDLLRLNQAMDISAMDMDMVVDMDMVDMDMAMAKDLQRLSQAMDIPAMDMVMVMAMADMDMVPIVDMDITNYILYHLYFSVKSSEDYFDLLVCEI